MRYEGDIILTIHGLDEFNRDVDGEVFAEKLNAFIKSLIAADIAANGKRRHKFLISALAKNTATAGIREQVAIKGGPANSGVDFYGHGLTAIYDDSPDARHLPKEFLRPIALLNRSVGDRFAFGEVKFKSGEIVRIDEFLQARAAKILEEVEQIEKGLERFFKGSAYGAFDGVLKAVDLRGEMKRAFLILSAGGLQVDCNVDQVDVGKLRQALDHRTMVFGIAHYGGKSGLPVRIDVMDVELTKTGADLSRWRGQFSIPEADEEDWGDL